MVKRYPARHDKGMNYEAFQEQQRQLHAQGLVIAEQKKRIQELEAHFVKELNLVRQELERSIFKLVVRNTKGYTYSEKKRRNAWLRELRAELALVDLDIAKIRGINL